MRIRQVKPAFWVDRTMAGLPRPLRLTYIGLWMLADDEGFLPWDVAQAGAELYPFETPKVRERFLAAEVERLIEAGRVVAFEDCHCLHIPTLKTHQRVSGIRSTRYAEAHAKHSLLSHKQSPLSDSPGTVGNGKGRERNVEERNGVAPSATTEFRRRVSRPA